MSVRDFAAAAAMPGARQPVFVRTQGAGPNLDTVDAGLIAALPFGFPALRQHRIFDPMGGRGALLDGLAALGLKVCGGSDIAPRRADILKRDLSALTAMPPDASALVTNPPTWPGQGKRTTALVSHMVDLAAKASGVAAICVRIGWLPQPGRLPLVRSRGFDRLIFPALRPLWGFTQENGRAASPIHSWSWVVWDFGRVPGPRPVVIVGQDELTDFIAGRR